MACIGAMDAEMTDDIVTRLWFALENFRNDPQPVLLEDAADEIEELRKDLSLQARCISRHYDQFADLRNEIERLRKELALAEKWRDNFKLAWERERTGRRTTLMTIEKENKSKEIENEL